MERLLSPPPYFELSSRREWWKTEERLTVLNKTPCKFPLWTSDKYLYGHKGLFISPSPWMIYMLLSIFITHSLGLEQQCTRTGSFSKEMTWLRDGARTLGGGGNISSDFFSAFHSSHFPHSFPLLTFPRPPPANEFHLFLKSLQSPNSFAHSGGRKNPF